MLKKNNFIFFTREPGLKFNFINVALLSFSASAFSLGMGDLQIKSYLNQPFYGEIKLIDVGDVPLTGIQAAVASLADFERIGLNYDDDLDKLNLKVRKNEKGEPVIVITSTERINEPYLELVVDLAWSNGQLYRAYTLLLDPPKYEIKAELGHRTSSLPYGKKGKERGVVEKEVYVDKTVSPSQDDINRPESSYGPTTGKEDIYQIAQRYVTANTTLQQVILAINGANLTAFKQGNINGLMAGKILKIPSNDDVTQIPKDLAAKEIAAQDKAWATKQPIDHVLIPPYTKGIVIAPDSKLEEISKPSKPLDETGKEQPNEDQSSDKADNQPEQEEQGITDDKTSKGEQTAQEGQSKSVISQKQEKSALLFNLSPDSILPTIAGHSNQPQPEPEQPKLVEKKSAKFDGAKVKDNQAPSKQLDSTQPDKAVNEKVSPEIVPDSVSGLKQQLTVLKESNNQLQQKMAQRDQDIAQLKQQLSLLIKTRQGIAGQTSSPVGVESEFPWLWIFLLLIAASAGAGGYYYREQLQALYLRRKHGIEKELPRIKEEIEEPIPQPKAEEPVKTSEEGSETGSQSGATKSPIRKIDTPATVISPEDIDRELAQIKQGARDEALDEVEPDEEVSVKISRKSANEEAPKPEKTTEKKVSNNIGQKTEKSPAGTVALSENQKEPEEDNPSPISKESSDDSLQLSEELSALEKDLAEQQAKIEEDTLKQTPQAEKEAEVQAEQEHAENLPDVPQAQITEPTESESVESIEFESTPIIPVAASLDKGDIEQPDHAKEDERDDEGLTFEKVAIEKSKSQKEKIEEAPAEEDENLLEFDIDTDAIFAASKSKTEKNNLSKENNEADKLITKEPKAEAKEPKAEAKEPKAEAKEPKAEAKEPKAEAKEPKAEAKELKEEPKEPKVEAKELEEEAKEPKEEVKAPKVGAKKSKEEATELDEDNIPVYDIDEEFNIDNEFSLADLVESATGHSADKQSAADKKKLVKSKKAMETLLSLAETYITMGDKESARQSLEEVLEYGDDAQKEAAKKLIKNL
jgi:pilus assembly protein FimV